jgi:molecular chaperone GrpE
MTDELNENDIPAEDFAFEPDESEGELSATKEKIKTLREKLSAALKERDEYLAGWQRAKADYINARKDELATQMSSTRMANERTILEILPVLDSFGLAFSNKESWEKVDENWRKGVEYIATQLKTALTNIGLQEIGKMGEQFDPNYHNAIENIGTTDKKNDHTVAEVVQNGYLFEGKIIRPAKVKVFVFSE